MITHQDPHPAEASVGGGATDPPAEPKSTWIDEPRLRRVANLVAAALVFYWVLERLWPAPGTLPP